MRAFFACLSLLVSGNVEVHCLAWSHSEWTEEGQKRGGNEGCQAMMDRSMAPGQGMELHLSASVSLSVKWGLRYFLLHQVVMRIRDFMHASKLLRRASN